MSPNGISRGFDIIFTPSSSESSDSESFFQEDLKSSGTQINSEWEAIERTLYQEPGQQVTDPELLKECKLWRETFPHFRVKGTKIDINQMDNDPEDTAKSVQTLENHFNLKKLEEKRESIKNKVVEMLVDRLITKYGPVKQSANSEANSKSGVEITEIDENSIENFSKNASQEPVFAEEIISTDKESYFERGKLPKKEIPHYPRILELAPRPFSEMDGTTVEQIQKNYDFWERDMKTAKELSKTYDRNDFKRVQNHKNDFPIILTEKPTVERFKLKKTPPPRCSLGNSVRPLEMNEINKITNIDKKYEGLVDRIFERKCNEMEGLRHCRPSASRLETNNFQESLRKLRIGSGFEDFMKRNTIPRINKFDNNWLKKGEMNLYSSENYLLKNGKNVKAKTWTKKQSFVNQVSEKEFEEKFFEDLKREMSLSFKRSPKKTGVVEEINLKKFNSKSSGEKFTKVLSCGDLAKKNKKETKDRPKPQLNNKLNMIRSEPSFKQGAKHNGFNHKGGRPSKNQNQLLPPIETGIICTELTGRPKIGPRIPSKRY